jgi:pectate lyase
MRPCLTKLFLLLATLSAVSGFADALRDSPEIKSLQGEFPTLAALLTAEKPWEQDPAALAGKIFSRPPTLAQGSATVPLLLQDQRELEGWPGEKVFAQLSYETEYYVFDRMRPVIKLHVGRPLTFAMQHGRLEARAAARGGVAHFPILDAKVIPPLLEQLDHAATSLARFGARKLPSEHPLVSTYALPNDVIMTVTNLTGSTNETPYVEIMLTPAEPIQKFAGTQTVAFPGAEGAGRFALGGRGGKVYIVTSLDDYLPKGRPGRKEGTYGQASEHGATLGEGNFRPYVDAFGKLHPDQGQPLLPAFAALPAEPVIHGTLREAVEAKGPRYVVFAVSGDIALKSELVIKNPYITIAGQSAPGEGVQIRNWGVKVETHDVILRHLRIRVGEVKGPGKLRRVLGEQTHALDLAGINIIADHCEAAFANDQIFNTYGSVYREGATLQWSMIYGGPTKSTHEKGSHSMSTVAVGWTFVSLHHNLFAHTRLRNPRLDMLTYDFRNNVIYNFYGNGYGSDNDTRRLNYVGNTMKKGPDTTGDTAYAFSGTGPYWQYYAADNRVPADFKGVIEAEAVAPLSRPIPFAPVTTHPADEAFQLVVAQSGATKPVRDAITTWVAQSVIDGTGSVPGTPDDWPHGGFPTYAPAKAPADTNANGIPDAWELAHGLDLAKSKATGRDLDPHYDNIEVYLNSL